LSQLRQQSDVLQTLDVRVAVVTFQAGPVVEAYVRETQLTWPILIDDDLKLYADYGMRHGRWRDLVGPATFGIFLQAHGAGPTASHFLRC